MLFWRSGFKFLDDFLLLCGETEYLEVYLERDDVGNESKVRNYLYVFILLFNNL